MPSTLDFHAECNIQTRQMRDVYSAHRHAVMRVILDDISSVSSIGLVGAGNCNDVCLSELSTKFRDVVLIDPDRSSLDHAIMNVRSSNISIVASCVEDCVKMGFVQKLDRLVSLTVISQIIAASVRQNKSNRLSYEIIKVHLESLGLLANRDVIVISDFATLIEGGVNCVDGPSSRYRGFFGLNVDKFFDGILPHQLDRVALDDGSELFHPSVDLGYWSWERGERNLGVFAKRLSMKI